MTSSLIAREPSSARIKRFLERYRTHEAVDMNNVDYNDIEAILYEYFQRIDEMFFFKLLTREIQGVSKPRKLVAIKTHEVPDANILGLFDQNHDRIEIWLNRLRTFETYPLEHFICVLAHEMVHAYIGIFADERHDMHDEWVNDHCGHGTMFWKLLGYILDRLFELTGSERVWEQICEEESARRAFSRKPRCFLT
ncbi:hypothetical protein ONZ43_g1761 [Nemania bipapillata]|uniref:Uncharacterized protein n=1 Tax=Nemania bipapillata TaxID=110536 RepID=A0ACC2J3J9_9PEZI|nr:hypothetical protein ONZ43_g1761 [Nemania bipapillata]